MRQYPTDHRLWGLISAGLFAPIVSAWLISEKWPSSARQWEMFFSDAVVLAIACAVVGWVLHGVAVVCGVRLSGPADPPEAVDYDDQLPGGTSRGV